MFNSVDTDTKSVLYQDLIAVLAGAVQEEAASLKEMEHVLKSQEALIQELHTREAKLQMRLIEQDARMESIEQKFRELMTLLADADETSTNCSQP